MDGKEFGIDEAVIGETAPPFHPNCGCSIVGVVEVDEAEHRFIYDWTHNSQNSKVADRVTPGFLQKAIEISDKLGVNPDDLMAVMAFESWFDSSAQNSYGATGLIQFMPDVAKELGTTADALAKMSATEQLDYVYEYLSAKGELKTLSDIYMAILWPAAVGKPEDYVLWEKDGKYSGAYNANAGLDINGDGVITKIEATQMVIDRRNTFEKNKGGVYHD